MYVFNNEFYIVNEMVYSKKGNFNYEFPLQIIEYLKSNINSINSDFFDKEILEFLIEKNIIIIGTKFYDPFVKIKSNNYNYRLFIQLTEKCNLRCKHCYIGVPSQSVDYFNLDNIKSLILDAVDIGIYRIDFTGGEVFVLDYFFDLLNFLEFLPVSVMIFSNLTLLSDLELINFSKYKCVNRVITSLDYFNSDKHDFFRGFKGAFRATLKSIHKLVENDVKVTVNSMVLKDNKEDIIKMMNYFNNFGVDIHLDRVIIKGNAINNFEIFEDENKNYNDIRFIAEYIHSIGKSEEFLSNIKFNKCGVGENLIFVDKFGKFQLCPGLTDANNFKYYMGKNLKEAINNLKLISIKCENINCKYHENCSYGCRERALVENNSDISPDYSVCKFIEILEQLKGLNYEK